MRTSQLVFTLFASLLFIATGTTPVRSSDGPAAKNVLFLISDDLRANVLGCYGDALCKTPNLDRLAESGMLFERAYCQGVWCAPSRQSFMFSRYRDAKGVNLGEHFKTNGWYSARVGKIYHMRVPGDIIAGTNGKDVASSWTERFNSPGREAHTPGDYACLNQNIFTRSQRNRESTRMPNRPFVSVQSDGDGSDQPDYKSATKAIQLLREHRQEKFFLAVGFVRPHYPMVQPERYFDLYPWEGLTLPPSPSNDLADIPKLGQANSNNISTGIGRYPDNQKRMWQAYYASVTFMDEQVGRVLDELDALGLRESTVVVFTSDHGYHLGDHGFWQKSNLHEQVVRVPLIIRGPSVTAGTTKSFAELVDVYPTLSELVGLRIPTEVQGKSLVPVLHDPTKSVRPAALSLNKGYSLRTPNWQYIRYQDGSRELYDMIGDPEQHTNLAKADEHTSTLNQLNSLLDDTLAQANLND